nr:MULTISPECIES: hypothetical protein [Microbispora]
MRAQLVQGRHAADGRGQLRQPVLGEQRGGHRGQRVASEAEVFERGQIPQFGRDGRDPVAVEPQDPQAFQPRDPSGQRRERVPVEVDVPERLRPPYGGRQRRQPGAGRHQGDRDTAVEPHGLLGRPTGFGHARDPTGGRAAGERFIGSRRPR